MWLEVVIKQILARRIGRHFDCAHTSDRRELEDVGSVKSENAKGLRAQSEIDGFLVGGASLDPVSFPSIVNA